MEKNANSGIFVRTGPTSKKDQNGWPDNGYQIQCKDTIEGKQPLGIIIDYGAPPFKSTSDLEAITKAYRPTTEWNHYEICCKGEEMTVKLNGILITKATDIKNKSGHIGIQAEKGLLEFQNIYIQLL